MKKLLVFISVISMMSCEPVLAQYFYDNKTSSWMFSDATQDKQLAWHVSNHDSIVAPYGADSYVTSTSIVSGRTKADWVARWNLKCARKGIKNCFVWSNETTVTINLHAFQKKQISDSTRFSYTMSELEPYNDDLSYLEFYRRLIIVYRYCHDNTVKRLIAGTYMGWPKEWDKIVRYSDVINLHVYIASSNMSSPTYQYAYSRGRIEQIATAMDMVWPGEQTRKKDVHIIHSNESTFGGAYFKTHTYDEGFAVYKTGFNAGASAKVKRRVNIRQRADFVSGYDTRLNVSTTTRMMMTVPDDEPIVPKLLIARPDGSVSVIKIKIKNSASAIE